MLEHDVVTGLRAVGLNPDVPVLIVMVGLPRSGKSTWARKQCVPIVCPDFVRLAMYGRPYLEEAEPWVWVMTKTMIKSLFMAGHFVVILDAHNGTRKRRSDWINSMWQLVFKPITTEPDVCMDRAKATARPDLVPVIRKMASHWENVLPEEGITLARITDL